MAINFFYKNDILKCTVLICSGYVLLFRTWIGMGSWSLNKTIYSNSLFGMQFDYIQTLTIFQILCVSFLILFVITILRIFWNKYLINIENILSVIYYILLITFWTFRV